MKFGSGRWLFLGAVLAVAQTQAMMVRIRNIARPLGARQNQLSAVGLVVGLDGTGDSNYTGFSDQALSNLLSNYGINDPASSLRTKNVAVVMVTCQLDPFLKNGDKADVVVSSMGDATSLAGGVLVQTPLKAADGKVYAVAQGPVSVGGKLYGKIGSLLSRGPMTTGRIPNGAIVEQAVPATVVGEDDRIDYALQIPDYTTAARMAMAINETFAQLKPAYANVAQAKDASTVEVTVPQEFRHNVVDFMAAVEQVQFNIEEVSNKVVVNERTGTVVMGMNVAIDTVAVAHGNLNVNIQVTNQVSQPNYFQPGSSALFYNNENIHVKGAGGNLVALPETATIADLVAALNVIGATPADLISILQAINAAGALHGDLEIM